MDNNHHRHVHIVLRIHTKVPSCRFHVFNHTQRVARNYTQRVARLNGFLSQLFNRAISLAHVRSPGMYQHAVAPPTTTFHYSSTLPHNISPTTIIKVRGGHRHQQRHAYSPSSRPSSSCRRWWCCTSGFYRYDQRLIVDTTTARVDTTTTTTTSWGGWSGGDRTRPDFGQPLRGDLPYAVESDEFSVSRSPDQSKR